MGARRDGVDVQTRVVSVFRYRNGQQIERWFYPDDPQAWNNIFEDWRTAQIGRYGAACWRWKGTRDLGARAHDELADRLG
jgi:hypothetical protein